MALKVLTITANILFDDDNCNAQDLWEVTTDRLLDDLQDIGDFEFAVVEDFGNTNDLRDYVIGEYDEYDWSYEAYLAQKEMDTRVEQDYFGWQDELEEASKNWTVAKAAEILEG
jgi:hypothetical protein